MLCCLTHRFLIGGCRDNAHLLIAVCQMDIQCRCGASTEEIPGIEAIGTSGCSSRINLAR